MLSENRAAQRHEKTDMYKPEMEKYKEKNETYNLIVSKAAYLFKKYGYSAISITDIQKAANTTRGNFYYYFPGGKEELAVDVLKYEQKQSTDHIREFLGTEGDPVDNIIRYFESTCDDMENNSESISMNLLLLEMIEVNRELKELAESITKDLNDNFYNEIKRCSFSDEKTKRITACIVSMLVGAVNNCHLQGNETPLKLVIPEIKNIFVSNGYYAL